MVKCPPKVQRQLCSYTNTSLFTYSKWNFDGPGSSANLAGNLNCHFCSNGHNTFGSEILGHNYLCWYWRNSKRNLSHKTFLTR